MSALTELNREVGEDRTQRHSICIVAGDPSGDKHASKVIAQIRKEKPDLHIWGVGGPEMEKQGVELLKNCAEFAVLGFAGILNKVPMFAKLKMQLLAEIDARKPQMVVLVDFGGFNIALAQAIRPRWRDLPIYYFISPQVWGSRPWRADVLARNVSKMLVIFPFEEPLYLKRGLPARFVGHPLTVNLPERASLLDRGQFCRMHDLDETKSIIGVFPGSRKQEIRDFMPVIAQAITWMTKEKPAAQFVISRTNDVIARLIQIELEKSALANSKTVTVRFIDAPDNYRLMANADVLWAKSGTTTLEAAIYGTPMLIFYKSDWITYTFFLIFKTVHRVGWPNLLSGEELVPELIQLDCRAEQLVRYTSDLIDVPALRQEVSEKLLTLRDQLGQGNFARDAAQEILDAITSGHNERQK